MIDDAVSRADISLELFHSREEVYLASFSWSDHEVHAFGRRCGRGSVFLLKNAGGKTIGFITFTLDAGGRGLTINTGGNTGPYRNMGYGIPLLDSFSSLILVMGIEEVEITIGQNNPFVLKLITQVYGFGPVQKSLDQSMMIGSPSKEQPGVYPVHYIGEEARRLIEHGESEEPPDPFGPRYKTIQHADLMPPDSVTVYVGQSYRIEDRTKLYRRIFAFLPELYHHPDSAMPHKRIIWKSHGLAQAQIYLMSDAGTDVGLEKNTF